jgi:probable HAF family extracellular repeat protein
MTLASLRRALIAGLLLTGTGRAASLQSLTLNIPRVSGCGGIVIATVTISPAAGTGGAVVDVSGATEVTDAPANVTVPAGTTSTTFNITGKPVTSSQTVTITASYGGVSKSQNLIVDPAARFPYRVEAIGDLGGTFSSANGINARGEVAGTADIAADIYHVFRTNANLVMTDLTPSVPDDANGLAINTAGQVVGDRVTGPSHGVLIRVEADGTLRDFTTADGPDTYGQSINASGQMAGWQYPGGGSAEAYRTTAAGVLTRLGRLSGGTYSIGNAINDSGQVAGTADDANGDRAFRTTATGNLSTATVLGPVNTGAYAMNNAGVVTGETYNSADGLFHLFRASSSSVWQDLGTIPGLRARGEAINGRNEIVGSVYSHDDTTGEDEDRGAILYTDAGGITDLNTLIDPTPGWFLAAAYGINDAGQIVGIGRVNGVVRGFRLTPTGAPFPYGDANRDGAVNLADVTLLLRIAGGFQTVPDLLAADVAPVKACDPIGFGDGKVDIQDAVRVARRVAGLEPNWP